MGETMPERMVRESEEGLAAREAMKGRPAIERLVEAAVRSIQANGDDPVGKDGRTRWSIAKAMADGDMASALRDLGKIN